jgi:hypothetical protein
MNEKQSDVILIAFPMIKKEFDETVDKTMRNV